MFTLNDNFCILPESYLFSEVARRINAFKESHPEADVIRMGIGDVTLPLCPAAIEAMHKAVDDESSSATPSLSTITKTGESTSTPLRFLSATVQKATPAISATYCRPTTPWP